MCGRDVLRCHGTHSAHCRRCLAEVATTRFLAAMAARGTPLPPSTGRADPPRPPPAGMPFLCLNPDDTFALGLLEFTSVPRSAYHHPHGDTGPPDSTALSTHLSVDFRRDVILEDSEASSPRSPAAAAAAAASASASGGIGAHGHPHPTLRPLVQASSHLHPHGNSMDGELVPQPLSPVPGTATPPASNGHVDMSLFSTHPRSAAAAAAAASAFSLHSQGSSPFSDIRWPIAPAAAAVDGDPQDRSHPQDGAITVHQNPYAFMLDRGVMDPAQWSGGTGGMSMWSRGSVAARGGGGRFNFGSILSSRGGRRADPASRDIDEWAEVDVPCYRVELPADFQGWLARGAVSTRASTTAGAPFRSGRAGALHSVRSVHSTGSGTASGSERGGGSSFWQRLSFTSVLGRRPSHGAERLEVAPRQGSGRSNPSLRGMRSYVNALADPHAGAGDGGYGGYGGVPWRRIPSLGSTGMLPLRHGPLSRDGGAEHGRVVYGGGGYIGSRGGLPRSGHARASTDAGGNFWGLPAWPGRPGPPAPAQPPEVHGEVHSQGAHDGLAAVPSVLLVEDLGEYTGSINIGRQEGAVDVPSLWTGPPRVTELGQAAGVAVPWGDLMLPSQGMHVVDSRGTLTTTAPDVGPLEPPRRGLAPEAKVLPSSSVAALVAEAGEAQSILRTLPSGGGRGGAGVSAAPAGENPPYWALMGGGFMDGVGSPQRFFERDERVAEALWQPASAEDHLRTVYEGVQSGDAPLEWTEAEEGTQHSVTIELTSFPAS